MSDSENSDASVTWEDFFGTSTDLGPSVLGMFDTLLEQRDQQQSSVHQNSTHVRSNSPSLLKQCLTANLQHSATTAACDTRPCKKQNSFISLSPNVKRILSNLDDADVSCDSEIISENCAFSRNIEGRATLPNFRSSNVSIKYETKKDNRCSLPRLNGPQFVIDRFSNGSLLSTIDISVGRTMSSISYEGLHDELRMADDENIGASEIWENGVVDKKSHNGSSFLQVPRPLSIASISSSTSTSSGSSCTATKNSSTNAYLASIESLDDDTDNEVLSRDSSTRSTDRRTVEDSVRVENGKRGSVANGRVVTVSAPVPPAVRPRYLDPQLSSVQRVLMEIVDTEAIYVTDLAQVIQGYLEPWEQDPPFSTEPDQQTQIISELFNNLRDVHALACSLLQKLRAADGHATEVARAFLAVEGGFEPYTHYCTGYPVTVRRLTELMRNEEAARAFRDRQQRLGHPLQLGAYLLKPVQRILKYHLLLQKLMKECDTSEVEDIRLALSTMTGIAQHINDMKRKHEHAVRVQEIQSLLYGWNGEDLTTFGELCAEGTFRMHGAKALRHVFLFDKMLLLAKNREDGILNYKFHILCSNLMLIESVPGEPLSFHVVPFDNPRLQYTLTARNLEQKREWTFQLKRVIIENYHTVIPSHARQLVMEIGQFRSEDDIVIEKSNSSKKQYSAPEYLQKRRMDRERRESEASLRMRLRKSRKSNIPDETECETSSDKRDRSQSRSRSREGLSKFSNWRRKSEPVADEILNCLNTSTPVTVEEKSKTLSAIIPQNFQINQYNHKTIPKKISKLRKARGDRCQNSTFYTDLFDFSNCDEVLHISESTDSLDKVTEQKIENESVTKQEVIEVTTNNEDESKIEETVENIVSQLLMQNQEFQRILKKQRKEIGLRNRINKTPLSNPKPKIEEHRDSTDSEADVEKSKEILLNNSSVGKNVVEKPLNLKTNNLEQEKSLKNVNQNNDRSKCNENKFKDTTADDKNNINKLNLKEDPKTENKNNVNYAADKNIEKISSELILNPSSPEIWLKHQTEFVTHSTPKKSDSLPRSFETLNEKFNDEVSYLNRDGKIYNDRPLTIASENTDEIETLILEKEENSSNSTFITRSPSNSTLCSKSEFNLDISSADTTTEIIYDIPNKNKTGEDIDSHNIHPEYKIYRPSVNLVSFKISLSKSSRQKSKSIDIETDIEKNIGSTVRNSRSLLQRFRRIVSEDSQLNNDKLTELSKNTHFKIPKLQSKSTEYINQQHVNCLQRSTRNLSTYGEKPQKLPIYKQGSSSLGARIAQSDYANPSELFLETEQGNVLINKLSMRPESILSNSSMITSSSEGFQSDEVTKVDTEETGNRETNDCFYEKQMDALETIVDNEVSRDSAIYSSDEMSVEPILGKIKHGEQIFVQKIESRIVRNNHIITENVENPFKNIQKKQIKRPTKLPPPIPVKPEIITVKNRSKSIERSSNVVYNSGRITDKCDTRPTSIVEKLQSLQINALENGKFEINKAVAQRRKEFQGNFIHVDSVSRKCVPIKNATNKLEKEVQQSDISKQCTIDQSNIVPSKGWVKRVVEKFE